VELGGFEPPTFSLRKMWSKCFPTQVVPAGVEPAELEGGDDTQLRHTFDLVITEDGQVFDAVPDLVRSPLQGLLESGEDHVVGGVAAGVDGDLPAVAVESSHQVGDLARRPVVQPAVAGLVRMILAEQGVSGRFCRRKPSPRRCEPAVTSAGGAGGVRTRFRICPRGS